MYSKEDVVQHLCETLGIKETNPFTIQRLVEAMESIEGLDVAGFVRFVESSIDRVELQYKNGVQKFLTACDLYYKEINKDRLEKAQSRSQELTDKVRSVKNILRQEFTMGRNPHWVNLQSEGKQLMSAYEILTLEKIGSIHYVLRLCDDGALQEAIERCYRGEVLHKPKAQLGNATLQRLVNKTRI